MPKYRKKPVVVEAFKYDKNDREDTIGIPKWFLDAVVQRKVIITADEVFIKTLEGEMKVSDGDYIIKGIKGEIYPCKPDIFEATYEEVTE